jgi:ABC-2 type transport system permease protein
VLAPLPVSLVALEKGHRRRAPSLLAAVVVFPIAVFVPAASHDLNVDWPVLFTLAPLAAVACSSLGLAFGASFDPRSEMALFAVLLTPIVFLGCTLYPWSALPLGPDPLARQPAHLRQRRLPRRRHLE